jgi:hypothetical protein
LQPRRVRVLYPYFFDLRVQLPSGTKEVERSTLNVKFRQVERSALDVGRFLRFLPIQPIGSRLGSLFLA